MRFPRTHVLLMLIRQRFFIRVCMIIGTTLVNSGKLGMLCRKDQAKAKSVETFTHVSYEIKHVK